jgi:hypothetical protein
MQIWSTFGKSVHVGVVDIEVKLCGKEVKMSTEKHLFGH